jgi:hypothetical protein
MGFREYLGAIDAYVGDDDILGAARRGHPSHGHAMRRRPLAHAAAATLHAANTGIVTPGPRIEPLGFTAVQFTAASGLILQATGRPQKPFKGSRLVVVDQRLGTGGLVSITSLKIGVREVLVSTQGIPAQAFAPNAFGIELMMDEAGPGIEIVATYVISAAPAGADVVNVGTTVMGMSWS